jgi:hypothetical protein
MHIPALQLFCGNMLELSPTLPLLNIHHHLNNGGFNTDGGNRETFTTSVVVFLFDVRGPRFSGQRLSQPSPNTHKLVGLLAFYISS